MANKYTIGSTVNDAISSKGNKYKKFNVRDEAGTIFNDACSFESMSQYSKIVPGAVIEGYLKEKDWQGKKSYTLEDGNLGPKPMGFGGGAKAMEAKAKGIEQAQERKDVSIKGAQDRKESAIEISATARDATLIVTHFYPTLTTEEIKVKWLHWRRWLLTNWDNTTGVDLTSHGDPVPDFEQPKRIIEDNDIKPEDIPF
jgi:hypothetical protein